MAKPAGEALARRLADVERRVDGMARGSQMSRRSIEGGAIKVYDHDGVERGSIGVQPDGTTAVVTTNDPVPSRPSAPILEPFAGGLVVAWDGETFDGSPLSKDFRRVEVHASTDPAFTPGAETHVQNMSAAGSVSVALPPEPFTVALVAATTGGTKSEPSTYATETPVGVPTSQDIDDVMEAASGKNAIYYSQVEPSADPEDAGTREGDVWFQRTITGEIVGMWEWTGDEWEARTLRDEVIATLTAAKITTGEIAVGQKIIAGPATGTHAEMSDTGFRVYAGDEVGGVPNEVIRLGTATEDYFGIVNPDGQLAASIDINGRGSFADLSVAGDPEFGGVPLSELLDRGPRGILAYGNLPGTNITNITTTYGLFELSFTHAGPRTYVFEGQIGTYPTSAPQEVYARLYYTTDGSSPTISSNYLGEIPLGLNSASTFDTLSFRRVGAFFGSVPAGTTIRILLSVYRGNGTASLTVTAGEMTHLVVRDAGTAMADTAIKNTGGGTTTPPVRTYEVDLLASWSQCYRGNGTVMTNANGHLYQGYDPSGSNGNQKSLIGWGTSVMSLLSGATVNSVQFYAYANHWYYNAGGTAVLGSHGHTSAPATWGGAIAENLTHSGSWPRPGARWVDVSGWDWKGGGVRGVVLGPGPSNSATYYGRFNGASMDYRPALRIRYTK